MAVVPGFLKYTVHSTVGKSWYSTATTRTTNPVLGSVYVNVRSVRCGSSVLDDRSSFQSFKNSAEGWPS